MVGVESSSYHGEFVSILLDNGSNLGEEILLFKEIFV